MTEVKKVETSYNVTFSITERERTDLGVDVIRLKNFLAENNAIIHQETYESFQETLDELLNIINFKK